MISDAVDEPHRTVAANIRLPDVGDAWSNVTTFELTQDLVVDGGPSATSYTVPAGFVTDAASVPRVLWSVFPPIHYFVPAAVHDHALQSGVPWPVANDLFDRVLRAEGVTGWRRATMVWAVRLYGMYKRCKRRFNDATRSG